MTKLAGLVIAGGASSRFGGEKALALLHGRPLLAWSLGALDTVCGEVAVSARPGPVWDLARSLGREALLDDVSHPSGPLAGLAAGLIWAERRGCSVLVSLPVDTPLIEPAAVRRLADAASTAPAAYAVTPGGAQPLCAGWSVGLAAPLIERLASGDHPPVRAWLKAIGASAVLFETDAMFRNVNTQADLLGLATPAPGDA